MLRTYNASEFKTSWNERDVIGCGGFAAVRKCVHLKFGQIAIKCFGVPGSVENIEESIEKNSREAKLLCRIRHANIVHVHGITKWSNCLGIIMDIVQGGNLKDLLHGNTRHIPWNLRLRITVELINALAYLHFYKKGKAIVHGDLKPENVLLTLDLRVKLGDFGSAHIALATKASRMTIDIPTNTQHSLLYTAPEFLKDPSTPRDPSMDVFSLGMIMYETITRVQAYDGASLAISNLIHLIINNNQRPNQRPLHSLKDQMRANAQTDDLQVAELLEETMKMCWRHVPTDRPDVDALRTQLCKELDSKDPRGIVVEVGKFVESLPSTTGRGEITTMVPLSDLSFPFRQVDHPVQQQAYTPKQPTIVDHKFFVIAGGWSTRELALKFEPSTGTFMPLPKLNIGRWHLCAACIGSQVFVIGGKIDGDKPTNTIECLDLDDRNPSWVLKPPLVEKRYHASAAALGGQIYVCGGWNEHKICLSTIEMCSPCEDTRAVVGDMLTCREGHSMVSARGKLYIVGGYDGTKRLRAIECFDPSTCQSTYLKPMREEKSHHACVYIDGFIYALGGLNADLTFLKHACRYDVDKDDWSEGIISMKECRVSLGCCCVGKKIYAVGGRSFGESMTTTEVYDASANQWEIVCTMDKEWYRHAVVAV